MTSAANEVDYVSAPADYTELFRQYYTFVVSIVRRSGIESSRAEDVASEILLRFFERDFLNEFDGTLVFTHGGVEYPARFKSFLTKFVLAYTRGYVDRHARSARREILLCDQPVGSGDACWIHLHATTAPGADETAINTVDEATLVAQIRTYLQAIPRRSDYDRCDLVELFDLITEQIRENGCWDTTALREHFGVSAAAMHSWIWWLRANLSNILGYQLPPKRRCARRTQQ